MNRLDPVALRDRLKRAGIHSKKSFGQHFLIDEEALLAIIAVADIHLGERVLEVGPGPGVLTERLLDAGAAVTAFEVDPDMVKVLTEDFPGLNLIEGDALQTLPEHLQENYKVVANIPYQITTPLIRLFLESGHRLPESMTLLVQKEVGERLAAKPHTGERGFLSVLVQYYADVSLVLPVPSNAFWPAPEVDSVVVHLAVKPVRALEDEKTFFKYVKQAFIDPRKQLKNVLAGIRGMTNSDMAKVLTEMGFSDNIRAQELTEEEWIRLFTAHV